MPEATAAKKFGQWVPSKHLTELHYFGFFELYSRHQQHSHTFSHYLASQNLTTLDSPSQPGSTILQVCIPPALALSQIFALEKHRDQFGMESKVPALAGKGCRSILRKFAAEMNKWANQWNNFVPSGRPEPNLEAACWVIDWRVVSTHPPTTTCRNAPIKVFEPRYWPLIGQSGQIEHSHWSIWANSHWVISIDGGMPLHKSQPLTSSKWHWSHS